MLDSMTNAQLSRLYRKCYYRMAHLNGYQPFGYDFRTLRLTQPAWAHILKLVLHAIRHGKTAVAERETLKARGLLV